jgi:hypothetical protein
MEPVYGGGAGEEKGMLHAFKTDSDVEASVASVTTVRTVLPAPACTSYAVVCRERSEC